MKKYTLLILVGCALMGCTDAEQDEKIRSFWMQQIMQFLPQPQVPPAPVEPQAPVADEQTVARPEDNTKTQTQNPQTPEVPPQPAPLSKPRVKRQADPYQFMEITMEDETAKVARVNTKVSAKDRAHIQQALENVRLSNQKTLKDIGQMFGPETQAQAFAIVARVEKVLQTSALNSESVQKYLNAQDRALKEQEKLLNQLLRNNARNLHSIRG